MTDSLSASFDKPAWLKMHGYSMFPGLLPGDLVRVAPLNENPEIGQIVIFHRVDRLVVHRVIALDRKTGAVITKGDASLGEDDPLPPEAILGIASMRRRGNALTGLRPRPELARVSKDWAGYWRRPCRRYSHLLFRAIYAACFMFYFLGSRWDKKPS